MSKTGETTSSRAATASTATGRIARSWVFAAVLIVAAVAGGVFANIIGTRFAARIDVTATGEHRLSPRTLSVLDGLAVPGSGGEHRMILAAPLRTLNPQARVEVTDVLAEMSRRQPKFVVSWLDTQGDGSGGANEFKKIAEDLYERERGLIESQAATIRGTLDAARATGEAMTATASAKLLEIREQLPGGTRAGESARRFFEDRAAIARVAGEDLRRAADEAAAALTPDATAVLPIPRTDIAGDKLRGAIKTALTQSDDLLRELGRIKDGEGVTPAVREAAENLRRTLTPQRDRLALAADPLERLRKPDVLRIAEALRAERAVILVGPGTGKAGSGEASGVGTLAALDFDAVVASDEAISATTRVGAGGFARADLRRRAEAVVASALAAMSTPLRPIVVFMHAEPRPFMEQVPLFAKLTERLELRGIDVVEWCVMQSPDPPVLSTKTPAGERPVVYVTLAPDSSTGTQGEQAGSQRAGVLGQAMARLADSGSPMLVSMNPSVLPTFGEKDPTVAVVERFGLMADTGKPILAESITPRGRVVGTDQIVQPMPAGDDTKGRAILNAVRGLPTFFGWAVPITVSPQPPAGSSRTPLYTIENSAAWAETQWLGYWQIAGEQRGLVPNPPKFDEGKDQRGPWTVAFAAERPIPGGSTQRLVAVGSNNWYTDFVMQREGVIDGRAVLINPGNAELFDAAVLWLAGQESLIAASPEARSVPLVSALSERQIFLLRAFLIAGLPMLVLAIGLAYRLVNG
jgi:hypothetical protein